MADFDAILLVSFGGPEGPDDVVPFLENVTAGRGIPRERLEAVGAHYAHFDGVSPINEQCRRIQTALRTALAEAGHPLEVYWGNRNWTPYLADTVAQMAEDGVERALAIVTSAYSSFSGCRQYLDDIEGTRAAVGPSAPVIDKIRAYHDHPAFIADFVEATAAVLATTGTDVSVLFTAHSLPSVMAAGCDYEAQLADTAALIAQRLPGRPDWSLVYQSRSGPPAVPWLEPDVNDAIRGLADAGATKVVAVPIGFVSDHMEVVWDLDHEAAATAESRGVEFVRVATPGTEPTATFVHMYVDLIRERLLDRPERAALGRFGARPDACPGTCCPPTERRR